MNHTDTRQDTIRWHTDSGENTSFPDVPSIIENNKKTITYEEFINEDNISDAELLIEDVNVYMNNNSVIKNKEWTFSILWNNSTDIINYEKYNLVLGNRLTVLNFVSVPEIIPYLWNINKNSEANDNINNTKSYIDLDPSKEIIICAYNNTIYSKAFQKILNLFQKINFPLNLNRKRKINTNA